MQTRISLSHNLHVSVMNYQSKEIHVYVIYTCIYIYENIMSIVIVSSLIFKYNFFNNIEDSDKKKKQNLTKVLKGIFCTNLSYVFIKKC